MSDAYYRLTCYHCFEPAFFLSRSAFITGTPVRSGDALHIDRQPIAMNSMIKCDTCGRSVHPGAMFRFNRALHQHEAFVSGPDSG